VLPLWLRHDRPGPCRLTLRIVQPARAERNGSADFDFAFRDVRLHERPPDGDGVGLARIDIAHCHRSALRAGLRRASAVTESVFVTLFDFPFETSRVIA